MGQRTSIAWTDASWNPLRGCSRVSPGCGGAAGEGGCYAEHIAARFSGVGQPYHGLAVMGEHGPRWTREVRLVEEHLTDPLRWTKPRRVFVNSMSDAFHESIPNEDIALIFGVMAMGPEHTFQVLTKRHERLAEWYEWIVTESAAQGRSPVAYCVHLLACRLQLPPRHPPKPLHDIWPLPNVWMGVSVENQDYAVKRIPLLARVPAVVRFVSYEPALGAVDFGIDLDATSNRFGLLTCPVCRGWGGSLTSLVPDVNGHEQMKACSHCRSSGCAIDWVIVGGESGPGARPFDLGWARSVIRQCKTAHVATFIKQMGAHPMFSPCPRCGGNDPDLCGICAGGNIAYPRYEDSKGGEPGEWPEDLRIREFPEEVQP
jgi:protein gp37